MKRKGFYLLCFSIMLLLTGLMGGCSKNKTVEDDKGTEEANDGITDNSQTENEKEDETKTNTPVIEEAVMAELTKDDFTPNWTLINNENGFTDLSVGTFVAAYNVLDYGADPTGEKNSTKIFLTLLTKLKEMGGGTLYVPDGMYKLTGRLIIPKGVTLRGDWKKPEKDKPVEGTVLMAYYGLNGSPYDDPFISMEIGAGVMNVAIWYPKQDPNNIQPYAPTITMGVPGYFGNEYNNVKNVTMINPYIGVLFSYENGGASPVINGLYGTPLYVGAEVDNIADVGRLEWIDLSPDYWIHSGLYARLGIEDPFKDNKAADSVKKYVYENATGVVMRRNDWSYTTYLTVDGYKEGYRASETVSSDPGAAPNGHHYDFDFTNCKTGVYIEATNDVGILFNKLTMKDCENGIVVGDNTGGAVQFTDVDITASEYAVKLEETSGTNFLMKQAEIQAGKVYVGGGTFNVMDTDFHNQASGSHITLGMSGRGNIIGNRFDGDPVIENKSFFESNIDHKEVVTEAVPEFMEYKPEIKVPAILQLFNVADETYGAVNDATITDNTQAIQKALDAAAQAGGGVVFLPPGKYRMDGSITIPKGVELRGTMDNSSVPHGEGSIFEVYAGENQPESDPFIIMEEGSGLRGITIDYPNQKYTGTQESEPDYKPVPYPYTIQGRGSDIYIINVGLRASYRGVDLYSYKCDNHYIDYLTGHVFNTGVRVGGNSANGKISNLQFNVIIYACGNESKFGSFPNSPIGVSNRPLYDYALQNLEFLVLGDCTGEILYNDFNYGSYKGLILRNDGNGGPDDGISMGLGLDGDTYTFYIEEGVTTDNFDFINTQVVSVGDSRTAYIYSEGNNSFDITLFASDYWGNPGNGIVFLENSGTLTLQTANFLHPGQDKFAVLKGGKLNIINSAINSTAHLVNNSEGGSKYISVQASVATPADIDLNTGEWINNIGSELPIATDGPIATAFDRNKWIGNASNNNGSTRSAFDSSINTRWDTGTAQAAGQWFSVDFGSKINFNCIIIDLGSSKGDAADAYHIYVSEDGSNWGEPVYSGEKLKGVIQIPNQNTRYLKIEQTGQVGSYWSIHEMYLYQYQE